MKVLSSISFLAFVFFTAQSQPELNVTAIAKPSNERINSFYQANQAPLVLLHLVKLPVGAIYPGGWLLKSLELQRDGLTGQLGNISAWLTKKNNAWLNKNGTGDWGWEEMPYWLKGYANLGYVLTAQYDSKWQENADPTQWPSFEIQPESAWNYGLNSSLSDPSKAFTVIRKGWPADNFPFTHASSPIEITTKGKKIPGWIVDQYGLCAELPQSPVTTTEKEEIITLVPMGAARLRISAFPVVK